MGRSLDISGTELLGRTLKSKAKIIVHEGSSSSSKTFSIAQYFIVRSFSDKNKTFSVVRKTMPAMKRGALKDFREALNLAGCYGSFTENKTDFKFTNKQTGTVIEFFALDNEQKARGPRRDVLWLNEGNELHFEDYRQLAMRTKEQIIIDYNPSMLRSWIYDEVLTRPDCEHIHSTYKVNTFLTEANRREIEVMVPVYEEAGGTHVTDWDLDYTGKGHLVKGDPYWWSVYGLGRRGAPSEAIYPYVYDSPGMPPVETVLGLDFGYNHPMVLARVGIRDAAPMAEVHVDELLFSSYLTVQDLISQLPEVGVEKHELIYADGSRPEMIMEIRRAGYNIKPADKRPGSVKAGIDYLKRHRLCFTARSRASKEQFQDYRWKKTPDGVVMDEPVKLNDDAPDAVRYGIYSHFWRPKQPRRISSATTAYTYK